MPCLALRLFAGLLVAALSLVATGQATAASDPCAAPGAIVGTSGKDHLVGTMGDDVICGLDGRDTLDGLGGDDVLVGGEGDDVLHGRAGADALTGGDGADEMHGGGADDELVGNAGADWLDGGDGADRLRCGSSTDRYFFDAADQRQGCEVNLTPGTGNLVVGIGDSNMASGQLGYYPDLVPAGMPLTLWPGYVDPLSILAGGVARAEGDALYGGGFGVSGSVTSTIFGAQLDRALALRPTAIVVIAGTNNITAGAPYVDRAKDDYRAGVSRIVAAGVVPVLTTLLPRNDSKADQTVAFNSWLRGWAAERGWAIADLHAALATSDGRFRPGTNRDDLHLTSAGAGLAAAALAPVLRGALPDADATLAPSPGGEVPTSFANALFLDDGDGDGRPDGIAGGAPLSLSTIPSGAHAIGRLLRAEHIGTDGSFRINVPAGPGRRYYLAARLQTIVEDAGGAFTLEAHGLPGYTPLWSLRIDRDLPAGSVLPPVTFALPASAAPAEVQLSFGLRRGGRFELGQLTLADVTG